MRYFVLAALVLVQGCYPEEHTGTVRVTRDGGASPVGDAGPLNSRPRGGSVGRACVPDCGARECGPDPKCGVSCGTCSGAASCVSGACVSGATSSGGGRSVYGEPCATSSDCEAGTCEAYRDGLLYCQGDGAANDDCWSDFDCKDDWCFARTLDGSTGACTPSFQKACVDTSISYDCAIAAIVACEYIQSCGVAYSGSTPARYKSDFDYCVASTCGKNLNFASAECYDLTRKIDATPCP